MKCPHCGYDHEMYVMNLRKFLQEGKEQFDGFERFFNKGIDAGFIVLEGIEKVVNSGELEKLYPFQNND